MIVPPLSSILSYSNRPPPLPSKWWQASDYLLDGYAPDLAADFVRDRYSLMGRAVPAEALFSRQGGPKWVMGPDGRLKEVPANTLAFDYSSGRRRLLLEGASTNLCQYSDNMMTYSWSPEKIEHEDGWVELVKRAGGDVYMSVASIANPGSGTYAFRVSLRSGLSTTCAVGLYTGNWGNAADLIDPIIEGPGVIAPVAGSSLFIVSGLTDEETVVTISRKVLDSDHSLGAFIYPEIL